MENKIIMNQLQSEFGSKVEVVEELNEVVARVGSDDLVKIGQALKSESFNFLTNLTAVDYPEEFTLVYNFRSTEHDGKLTIKTSIEKENPEIETLVTLWKSADWQEREVFDLFGIKFKGHPNLKRILLPDNFEGYPLRKDFEVKPQR
ncbi:NADH-quinone oxidoreductase subunit C [Desulfitispora alkaliphila]|uniref:NADH-quinone oxidoreductase subunit C n=1 Tax=Desulfitispora alkaliphila TaxID=622674 RepID=UPI003D23E982